MKTYPIFKHVGIAFAILVVSYLLFTLFPGPFPHPEDFSPTAFFVACGFVLIAWLRLKKRSQKLLYLIIPLLCVLALLDEIGYGSEVFGFQPLYLERYHVEIRDLHNLADFLLQIIKIQLEDWNWNGARFAGFVRLDSLLVIGLFIFTALLRHGMQDAKEHDWQIRISWLASGLILLAGISASAYLLLLPADPNNAFIFGFSLARLISISAVLLCSGAPVAYLLSLRPRKATKKNLIGKIETGLGDQNKSLAILVALWLILVLGFAYQIASSFSYLPDHLARLDRLDPLVVWLSSVASILLLAMSVWHGRFRRSITETAESVFAFFRREPPFIYTAFALALIVIALAIDQGMIPLQEWIVTPNFWVTNWGLWTEEVFEMTAAYEFIAAALFFRNKEK